MCYFDREFASLPAICNELKNCNAKIIIFFKNKCVLDNLFFRKLINNKKSYSRKRRTFSSICPTLVMSMLSNSLNRLSDKNFTYVFKKYPYGKINSPFILNHQKNNSSFDLQGIRHHHYKTTQYYSFFFGALGGV